MVEHDQEVYLVDPVHSATSNETLQVPVSGLKQRWDKMRQLSAPWFTRALSWGSKISPTPIASGEFASIENAGSGVRVYVMDTGINLAHIGFQGRAVNFGGVTGNSPYVNEPMTDTNSHGTHVAGSIGAYWYGVAQGATLVNVKVLGTGSSGAKIAQAISDIQTEHTAYKNGKGTPQGWKGSVINMSLTLGAASVAVKTAIANAYGAGIPTVVAAGNSNVDAGKTYPCAYSTSASLICVAATDNKYDRGKLLDGSYFSNYGSVVSISAPGQDIKSLDNASSTGIKTKSGTSMATPFVSGILATFISWEALKNDAATVIKRLNDNKLSGTNTGFAAGTPNFFAQNGMGSASQPYSGAPNAPAKRAAAKIYVEKRSGAAPTTVVQTSNTMKVVETGPTAVMETMPTVAVDTTAASPSPTSKPLSCSLQNQDPDQGITARACVCGSTTLPLLTVKSATLDAQSCSYTALPSSKVSNPVTIATSTYTVGCQACTVVGGIADTPSCTSIKTCAPLTGVANLTMANSAVHVGTLTASPLYTAISNALETACPSVTQSTAATRCTDTSVNVAKNIAYIESESLETDGQLSLTVSWSQYNTTAMRDAMIKGIANGMMKSAAGKNCYNQTYTVEELKKRDDTTSVWYDGEPEIDIAKRDHPYPVQEKIQFCNAGYAAQMQYWDPWWRSASTPGPTDYIAASLGFKVGPGGSFICDLFEGLADALAVIQPEFAAGEIELGEAIDFVCESELAKVG